MCFLIGVEAAGLCVDQWRSLQFNKVILDWMDGEISVFPASSCVFGILGMVELWF